MSSYHSWVELDASVLKNNLRLIRKALNPATEIILVVKSRAYGHGMAEVVRWAWEEGVKWFVVSHLEEAMELRPVLPGANILLLGAVWPAELDHVIKESIIPVLVSHSQCVAMAREARQRNVRLRCHLKVDTGMGRFGLEWEKAAGQIVDLQRAGGLSIEGLCTHFASAGQKNKSFAQVQADRFCRVVEDCAQGGVTFPFRHMANSAAFISRPEWDMDGIRCGILAYGYGSKAGGARVQTTPFLQWKTRVVQVKRVPAGFTVGYLSTYSTPAETVLATINVGYADGYSRLLSNQGAVLIRGRRAPIVGRVSMNFTTVDAGVDSPVREGDEVVLIGKQGSEEVWADELARWCHTIPYEILTSIRAPHAS